MENPEVAQIFEEVADLLDIQGANPFRVRAYRNAARMIRDLSDRLADVGQDKLEELEGIGKDLAGKIRTILDTGDLPLRQELCGQIPAGLRDLITLPGLGPKRARILHEKLRIGSLTELRQAAENQRIRGVEGFGAKTEEKILQALLTINYNGWLLVELDSYDDPKSGAQKSLRYLNEFEARVKG